MTMDKAKSLEPVTTPSRAARPDLDWSQIRETVMMLNLAVAQIKNSMCEGDDSINTLAQSFTELLDKTRDIGSQAQHLEPSAAKDQILAAHCDVAGRAADAVVSLQFYDKLVQRLSHVSASLAQLASLVADENRIYNPAAWSQLQETIRSKYTVESDRKMFTAILNGATIDEALAAAQQAAPMPSRSGSTDIELF